MTKITKRIISMMLTLCLLFLAIVPTFAAKEEEEEYLSDLRIVYADNLDEAHPSLRMLSLKDIMFLTQTLMQTQAKRVFSLHTRQPQTSRMPSPTSQLCR